MTPIPSLEGGLPGGLPRRPQGPMAAPPGPPPAEPMAKPEAPERPGEKLGPAQVLYHGPDELCESCEYFDGASMCSRVAGAIDAGGWCVLHSSRGGE